MVDEFMPRNQESSQRPSPVLVYPRRTAHDPQLLRKSLMVERASQRSLVTLYARRFALTEATRTSAAQNTIEEDPWATVELVLFGRSFPEEPEPVVEVVPVIEEVIEEAPALPDPLWMPREVLSDVWLRNYVWIDVWTSARLHAYVQHEWSKFCRHVAIRRARIAWIALMELLNSVGSALKRNGSYTGLHDDGSLTPLDADPT